MTSRKGRQPNPEERRRNAEAVAIRLMADRDLALMKATLLNPTTGVEVKNPASGKRQKGRERSPLPFIKVVIARVARERDVNARTLERHYYEFKDELNRNLATDMVKELTRRLNAADKIEKAAKKRQ